MHEIKDKPPPIDKPDWFWHRVYAAVIGFTFLVITALWAFSKYFST